MTAQQQAGLRVTLERIGNIGYWRITLHGKHIGDLHGNRTLGYDATTPPTSDGQPGSPIGTYPSRDAATAAILKRAGAA